MTMPGGDASQVWGVLSESQTDTGTVSLPGNVGRGAVVSDRAFSAETDSGKHALPSLPGVISSFGVYQVIQPFKRADDR